MLDYVVTARTENNFKKDLETNEREGVVVQDGIIYIYLDKLPKEARILVIKVKTSE